VPFGDQKLTLVLKPKDDLGGGLLSTLPWGFLAIGTLLSLGAALLAGRLALRRQQAEALAAENAQLFAQQQNVALTLQQSLLPDVLPYIDGAEFGVRYIAGVEDVEIGGDWYDVVALDERRVLFVVGDVSGRGLRAAAIMASLRFGARAYAAQGDPPHVILSKLSQLLNVNRDGHFATVLCGVLDFDAHTLVMSDAGHPPPLLLGDGSAWFVDVDVSPPIGAGDSYTYTSNETSIPAAGTLLAFTDGLIERRGQILDVGFERLRQTATDGPSSLELLLDHVVTDLVQDGADDDTALLGASWN
jgi:serine phosphatase RsbU (regulator of sigma subunit)